MAWLYRRPDSDRWWIGYRQNGKQVLRSTGYTAKEDAERELVRVNAMISAKQAGFLTRELFDSLTGKAIPNVSLKAALEGWIHEARGATGERTVEKYEGLQRELLSFFKATDSGPALAEITRAELQRFLEARRATVSAGTVNMDRKCLAIFFKRARINGQVRDNPVEGIRTFKAGREEIRARRPFTLEEMAKLYQAAPDDFWRFMILAGFLTGLRLGDLVTMPVGAVDWRNRCLRLVTRKTGAQMTIPLASPLYRLLKQAKVERGECSPTDAFWPKMARRYEATGSGWFSQRFYDLCLVKAGLVKVRPHLSAGGKRSGRRRVNEVSFHCLRHSCVSTHAAQGQNQQVVKVLAGHSSDEVNDLYTKLPLPVLKQAVDALPDITRPQ